MLSLQYPDPNKSFKLFTDASTYSYSGISHQPQDEETDELIPITYFSRSFKQTQQLFIVTQKECYIVCRSINKFSFYLTGAECTLCCDHKPLAPFLTTGMKSKAMDRWALKLQQYNIKFQHVAGKANIVADAISCLKTANLYEEPKDRQMSKTPQTIDDVMENLINLDSLIAQQKSDRFCKNKVKHLHHQQKLDFKLDDKGVLRKLV